MQRPGASCLATAVRTLTTGSQATGRLPADDPLPTVDAGALRASAASPDGMRTITDESSDPGTLNEIVTPLTGATAASRSPFAERSTLITIASVRAGTVTDASPRCTGPSRSLPADTSRCTAPSASIPAITPRVPEARLAICHPITLPRRVLRLCKTTWRARLSFRPSHNRPEEKSGRVRNILVRLASS